MDGLISAHGDDALLVIPFFSKKKHKAVVLSQSLPFRREQREHH